VSLLAVSLLQPVTDLDRSFQDVVQSARRPSLETVMRNSTELAKPVVVLGMLLGVAAFTGPLGPETARAALYALLPTNIVVETLKRTVNRTRPDGGHNPANASFPSSHAANGAALATVLSSRWRRLRIVFWLLAALVAFSRMYLNRHFLSDVLIAVMIGVVFGWLATRKASWATSRR
jgi:undecaprenyl-diphosphatase